MRKIDVEEREIDDEKVEAEQIDEDDVYSSEYRELLLDEEEIDIESDAFMRGYGSA